MRAKAVVASGCTKRRLLNTPAASINSMLYTAAASGQVAIQGLLARLASGLLQTCAQQLNDHVTESHMSQGLLQMADMHYEQDAFGSGC